MAMKMEKFFWGTTDHKRVVISKKGINYSLGGMVFGRKGFEDGSKVMTSPIVSIEDGRAFTESGSVYLLGKMHPDYEEILLATETGIPIITDWSLKGNLRDGYILTGRIGEDVVAGRVNNQKGNYVILDGTKCLVVWRNMNLSPEEEMMMAITGRYCDLLVGRDFSEYMNKFCRPNLMA